MRTPPRACESRYDGSSTSVPHCPAAFLVQRQRIEAAIADLADDCVGVQHGASSLCRRALVVEMVIDDPYTMQGEAKSVRRAPSLSLYLYVSLAMCLKVFDQLAIYDVLSTQTMEMARPVNSCPIEYETSHLGPASHRSIPSGCTRVDALGWMPLWSVCAPFPASSGPILRLDILPWPYRLVCCPSRRFVLKRRASPFHIPVLLSSISSSSSIPFFTPLLTLPLFSVFAFDLHITCHHSFWQQSFVSTST